MLTAPTAPAPLRALGYVRVSTDRQADSGLGLDAQRERIADAVARRGWHLTDVTEDAGASGGSLARRPELAATLDALDGGAADVLVVAKLDRLTRSVADLAAIAERAKRRGWALVVLDADVDTSTPTGELLLNVMVSAAQYERRLIGERTAAALAQRRRQGLRHGTPPELPQAVRERIAVERDAGRSLRAIADALNAEGVPTARGASWHASTVRHVVRSVALDVELAAVRAGAA